jgi:hypothetical protein
MPLAKLYTNSMLSTLNARALNQTSDGFISSDSRGQRPGIQRQTKDNSKGRQVRPLPPTSVLPPFKHRADVYRTQWNLILLSRAQ